jgi:hypothetical protein
LSWSALGVLAGCEAEAFAVHLEDVDMVRQALEERAVSRSERKTEVHSSNGRLLVTSSAVRS